MYAWATVILSSRIYESYLLDYPFICSSVDVSTQQIGFHVSYVSICRHSPHWQFDLNGFNLPLLNKRACKHTRQKTNKDFFFGHLQPTAPHFASPYMFNMHKGTDLHPD